MIEGRYGFTSVWGAICAGIGWIVLVMVPVTTTLAAVVGIRVLALQFAQLAPTWRGQTPWTLEHPNLTVAAAMLVGLFLGFVIGGASIVAGQRLRIEVDALNVQLAMLERLDGLATSRENRPAGRFTGLAGE